MKTMLLLLLSLILVVSVSCGGDDNGTTPTPTTGTVTGTITLQAGMSGNVDNSMIGLYATLNDWNNYNPVVSTAATGSSGSASYTLDNINPDTYYIDAWKDNDNSGGWSSGDLVGWYGSGAWGSPSLSPFMLSAGETKVINMNMIVIP